VPIRNRNGVRVARDSVPQQLQVVDLLIDRQVVEIGQRKRDLLGMTHVQTDE